MGSEAELLIFWMLVAALVQWWNRGYTGNRSLPEPEPQYDEFGNPLGVQEEEIDKDFQARFEAATKVVTQVFKDIPTSDVLAIYSYYKQSTAGAADPDLRPSILDPKARSKFTAWESLGNMPKSEAMKGYIEKVESVFGVTIEATNDSSSRSGYGLKPSVMVAPNEDESDVLHDDPVVNEFLGSARTNEVVNLSRLLAEDQSLLKKKDKNFGMTALHFAADANAYNAALVLLQNGADPNAVDNDGSTPLHTAAVCENSGIVELLLKKGADPNVLDGEGKAAVDLAVAADLRSIIAGADDDRD